MRKHGLAALGAAAALAMAFASLSIPAQAKISEDFYGRVVHVSTDNIKVRDPQTGTIRSFVMLPSFNRMFYDGGKPTQMVQLHPGMPVEIVYDTTALGIRHVDRIIRLHGGYPAGYRNDY